MKTVIKQKSKSKGFFISWIDGLVKECNRSVSQEHSMTGLKNFFNFFPPKKN